MPYYQITLKDDLQQTGGMSRRAGPPLTVEADEVVYESDGGVLVAVKFVRTDGSITATFNGANFVSAIALDALPQVNAPAPEPPVTPPAGVDESMPAAKAEKDK
jgi:hypothetical protein